MAIAYDNSKSETHVGTTHTTSFTVGGGSNRGLLVYVWSVGTDLVTGVTYAGVSMTLKETVYSGGSVETMTSWILPNPTTGANNIVVTQSGSSEKYTMAASYTDLDQTDFVNTDASTVSTTSPISVAPTPSLDNCWVVSACGGQRNGTASTGVTARAGNGTQGAIGDSNGTVTNGVGYTTTFTIASPVRQLMISTVIKPASATTIKTYNGTVTANVKTVYNSTAIASRKTWNGIT